MSRWGYPCMASLKLLRGFLVGPFRSRADHEAEIVFLRQQLLVATRFAPAKLRLRGRRSSGPRLALPALAGFAVTLVQASRRRARRRNHEQIDGSGVGSMVAQKGLPAGEGGPRRRGMYLATVDWAISIPSFSSAPHHECMAHPERVVAADYPDQITDLCRDRAPTDMRKAISVIAYRQSSQ
jgi:hypothetical protein